MEQAATKLAADYYTGVSETTVHNEANASGVSWAAVIGGALVAAAISLILLALGTGLGLSQVSVWSNAGAAASSIGGAAILWMIVMQVMSSSLGGYLAGRLRTRWTSIHADEVYFRDTAHGFLAWAVALVVTAAFLASAAGSMIGVTASSISEGAGRAVPEGPSQTNGYFVDTLLRPDKVSPDVSGASLRGEVGRVLANALQHGAVSAEDQSYLDRVVSSEAGISQPDADKRVSEVFANAKQTTEALRKATAHALLWTFVSLLIGAFCASFAGALGGKQRDRVAIV
jgi:hypothetical protein